MLALLYFCYNATFIFLIIPLCTKITTSEYDKWFWVDFLLLLLQFL